MDIHKLTKGALIGMVLGDGCLQHHGKYSRLNVSHSMAQKEYLLYKGKLVKQIPIGMKVYTRDRSEYPNTQNQIGFWTGIHPELEKLYQRMYHENHRTVDEHIIKSLDNLGIAIWYLDDGWYYPDKFHISVCRYTQGDIELMKYWLAKKHGLSFSIKNYSDRRKNRINNNQLVLDQKHSEKFKNIISVLKPVIGDYLQNKCPNVRLPRGMMT